MTISYKALGAVAQHTDTVTPAFPTGAAAGQLAILQVASGHPADSVPSTPSGWALAGSFSGGGGTFGAGVGPRRITMFVRVMTGGDAQPTTSIPTGGTGSVIAGTIALLSRSAGTGWRWAWTAGEDATASTSFSAPCTTSITWAVGDMAWWGYSVADSSSGLGTASISVAGETFDAMSGHLSTAVTTGNGVRIGAASAAVTSGSGSAAPTVTANTTVTTGVAGVLRVREASSNVTASAQSVFPTRNLVSATGLTGDDIVTASLYRQIGTAQTAVRAASNIDVTGQSSLLRVDAEQPFGVPMTYAALLTDVNGVQWTVSSTSITSTVSSDVISDAIRGVGAAVKVESPLGWKRDRDANQFNINGRIVVVGKARSSKSGTITVRTETDNDGDALNAVLDQATEGVILVRKQTSLPRLDGTYALIDDSEDPNWYDEYRWFQLNVVSSDDWPDTMEAAGYTLQDIADNYSTLSDIAAAFPGTLLDIALHDFGP